MKLLLSDWRDRDGVEQTLVATERWPSFNWQGQDIQFAKPVELNYKLQGQQTSLLISGTIRSALKLACSRCAEDFVLPINLQVNESIPLSLEDDQGEPWDSAYLDREQEALDLSELGLQVILESLSLQPICRPDCKGLCTRCGQNFNQGNCKCLEEEIDPRLAILGTLLKKKNN